MFAMWTRISRVNSTSEAISNMSEHGEHQRDETSVADLGKRRENAPISNAAVARALSTAK